jgi:Protein of unknown function (DUF3667)
MMTNQTSRINVTSPFFNSSKIEFAFHSPSLRSFVAEATEVLTHGDSRLRRTLAPLICCPGLLTQQYLLGRRASYLPPFRLYVVLSVLFFLVFSFSGPLTTKSLETGPGAAVAGRTASNGEPASTEELCRSSVSHLQGPGGTA